MNISNNMGAWNCIGLPPEGVAVLSLGGNLGDVESSFRKALVALQAKGLELLRVSSLYATKAEGCEPGAPEFLNAAAIGRWNGTAHSLLAVCKELEEQAGRPAGHLHWRSRTLDIDIVALGALEISGELLALPHPLAMKRLFVMEPLAEIAPDLTIPSSECAAQEALRRLLSAPGACAGAKKPFAGFYVALG